MYSKTPVEKKIPLKIAVLVRQFPNIVQTYILNHLISLTNADANITIIAVSDPEQAEVHPAVERYNFLNRTLYTNTLKTKIFKHIITLPIFQASYLSSVKKIVFSNIWKKYGIKYVLRAIITARALARKNYDIVHSHTLISSYEYLYFKEIYNIPIVTTFHGFEPKSSKPLATNKISLVFDETDAFIVNTHFAEKQLTDLGCDKDKIHIIPQGTNIQDFPYIARTISIQSPINITSVGRLSIEKGFHVAIKAISESVKLFPEIKYHIIGSGPEHDNLLELISSLDLEKTVIIHGGVSTDELLAHYANAHIFILPSIDFRDGSHTETQGVVLQEAQSSGIPVIASNTGGIPEVVQDGITGLLFEEENDEQLAKQIQLLIRDQPLYEKLRLQARQDMENTYDINVIGDRLIKVYEDTICKQTRT